MSASIKHLKTSDSPWGSKDVSELTIGSKPCRSALAKTSKLEISNFLSNYRRANSTMNNNNFNSNMTTSLNSYTNSVMKMNAQQQELNDRLAYHLNNQNRPTVKIEYIAHDMLVESVKRVWLEDNKPADIALHALGTIWEIHEFILEDSSYLSNIYKEQSDIELTKSKAKIETSKEKALTNISREYLDKMKHIYLDIDDSSIDKNS